MTLSEAAIEMEAIQAELDARQAEVEAQEETIID